MFTAPLTISVCLHAHLKTVTVTIDSKINMQYITNLHPLKLMITASPMRLQVICEGSNSCTFSWQRPPIHYTRQGTLLNYFINCSTMGARRVDQTTSVTSSFTYTSLRLQPYRPYNCCVAAVNEAGRGNSFCQTIITHEAGKLYTCMCTFI